MLKVLPGRPHPILALLLVALLLPGCVSRQLEREAVNAQDLPLPHESAGEGTLRAHLLDGDLLLLEGYRVLDAGLVSGRGQRLDPARRVVAEGDLSTPVDSVVLFEIDRFPLSGASQLLIGLGVMTTAVAVACAANPKACFGSCPTFYAPTPAGWALQAEGFSSSIAPSLEARDRDALGPLVPDGDRLTLRMTNEAYETHAVRSATLVAAWSDHGGPVLQDQAGELYAARELLPPTTAPAPMHHADGVEWECAAGAEDLAERIELELAFPPGTPGPHGIAITARQTLMTTYLFYQAIAWMGTNWGAALASLERRGGDPRAQAGVMGEQLGRIELLVPDGDGGWELVGEVGEVGPIARDTKVIPLPEGVDGRRARLRMTRGLWRIDRVALATGLGPAHSRALPPVAVTREGADDPVALAALLDPERHLATLPGDAYELVYDLGGVPDPAGASWFLDAQGYYLEWMREEWLPEEDPARAARLFLDPAGLLRELAPEWATLAPTMDEVFWRSRYGEAR